jgi:hypothetical protein
MGSARLDPSDTHPPADETPRPSRLASTVCAALQAGDWRRVEQVADTRDPVRAARIGRQLATALPAESARLDAWLDGRLGLTALFAVAAWQKRRPRAYLRLMARMAPRYPAAVEKLMSRYWARRPTRCFERLPRLLSRLAARRPLPARAIGAMLHGCGEAGRRQPEKALELLASLFPTRATELRRIAARIVGQDLLRTRTRETAEVLVTWLDRDGLDRVARESLREARRRVGLRGETRFRDRLVALRGHPRLGPLM